MKMLPHIASRVLGTPLVIGQAKLEASFPCLAPASGSRRRRRPSRSTTRRGDREQRRLPRPESR